MDGWDQRLLIASPRATSNGDMGSLGFLLVAISVFKSKQWHEEWGGSPDSTPSRPTVTESNCHLKIPSNLHEMSLLELSPLLNKLLGAMQRGAAAPSLAQHGVLASGSYLGASGCAPCLSGAVCSGLLPSSWKWFHKPSVREKYTPKHRRRETEGWRTQRANKLCTSDPSLCLCIGRFPSRRGF